MKKVLKIYFSIKLELLVFAIVSTAKQFCLAYYYC